MSTSECWNAISESGALCSSFLIKSQGKVNWALVSKTHPFTVEELGMFDSFGANSHGQLGNGKICELVAEPVDIPESLLHDIPDLLHVKDIFLGGGHSFILFDDGSVYGCGWNNKGQLASDEDAIVTFTRLQRLQEYHIVTIATTWDTCYAVTKDGVCIGWGSNSFSQLARPSDQLGFTRTPVVLTDDVISVACGARHCVLLKRDGSVYTAGDNKQGQLGRSIPKSDSNLLKVEGLTGIVAIACGFNHSVALAKSGDVYGWGCNKWAQLSFDAKQEGLVIPKPIQIDLKTQDTVHISRVCAGWSSTHFLTEDGRILSYGRNNYGQLGEEGVHSNVIKFSVGSEHCLALTSNGELMAWGWNEHGNCGSGTTENQLKPIPVKISRQHKVLLFAAGAGHNLAILDDTSENRESGERKE